MRLQITVTWVLATPLSIAGAPADNPLVDVPLLRRYSAVYSPTVFLPASTVKGKLRGEAERLLRTLGFDGKLCRGRKPETMCPAYWWDKGNGPEDDLCVLCRLFGAPGRPSALYFSDVTADNLKSEDAVVRPGVGISRVRGTAREDLLFFTETAPAVPEGIRFGQGIIEGEVPDAASAGLLWAAVQQVAAFGNGRSRGRGWLKTREVKVEVDGAEWSKEKIQQALSQWLAKAGGANG
ncbi:MAG: RAMP superfamily CRISPR-associated protein [Bacillota bacterium]